MEFCEKMILVPFEAQDKYERTKKVQTGGSIKPNSKTNTKPKKEMTKKSKVKKRKLVKWDVPITSDDE